MSKPRFTITLTLHDNYGEADALSMAVGVDEELRISTRAVDEMKAGLGLVSFEETVALMRRREFRKAAFKDAALRLGALMAERMEDAEGWHDTSRIEPARASLGWKS